MYWNTDILRFFAITEEDIPVFVRFHEAYKAEILEK